MGPVYSERTGYVIGDRCTPKTHELILKMLIDQSKMFIQSTLRLLLTQFRRPVKPLIMVELL